MPVRLGVNIDHVATLRQQRREGTPDPIAAAQTAQAHGADSIVAHLREDRRHIQDADIRRLRQILSIPLAMEMAATDEMVRIACDVGPARVCLVPEKRQELTTEGGLDVAGQKDHLAPLLRRLREHRVAVSLFIDPDLRQVRAARDLGADMIELHTGAYARSAQGPAREKALEALRRAAEAAAEAGLELHAGHGLDYQNVKPVANLPGMRELNIGFSIIARAVFIGLGPAVEEMKGRITS